MKTVMIIASANEVLKTVSKNLREGNREYTSLSRVLKDIQRSELLKAGYGVVFDTLKIDRKITPKAFLEALEPEMWGQTYNKAGEKVGEKWVGLWGLAKVKDAQGNIVYDETPTGEKVARTEPVLRKVTAWTPNKLFKVYSQSQAAKAQKLAAAKEAAAKK